MAAGVLSNQGTTGLALSQISGKPGRCARLLLRVIRYRCPVGHVVKPFFVEGVKPYVVARDRHISQPKA